MPKKKANISFTVTLDDNNIPEKIEWLATDHPDPTLTETKVVNISLWDHQQQNTLRIDLWTKEVPITDIQHFYIDCIGGLSKSLKTAMGENPISKEIDLLCEKLATLVTTN